MLNFGGLEVSIDVRIILVLLLVGAAFKHLKVFEKIYNDIIPVILMVVGIALGAFLYWPITQENIITVVIISLASTMAAIGLHSSGKNIFVNGAFSKAIEHFFAMPQVDMNAVEIKDVASEENTGVEKEENKTE